MFKVMENKGAANAVVMRYRHLALSKIGGRRMITIRGKTRLMIRDSSRDVIIGPRD